LFGKAVSLLGQGPLTDVLPRFKKVAELMRDMKAFEARAWDTQVEATLGKKVQRVLQSISNF
jgi:hypothetical protein